MVEKIADRLRVYVNQVDQGHEVFEADFAETILDTILPQVSTVAELEALDERAVVMNPEDGLCSRASLVAALTMLSRGPLTVVWRPEATA
jgi:hypothetical protein